jgi:taurine dioxygenase
MELRPVSDALGVEAVGVDLRRLSDADFDAIYRAWVDRHVLLVRGQELDDDDLVAFTRRFGDIDDEETVANALAWGTGVPGVLVVSNVVEDGREIGILGAGEAIWHSDMNFIETPTKASLLYSLEIPSSGGDTGFCNLERALDTLPDDLRRRIDGLSIKHDASTDSGGYLREGFDPVTDVSRTPGAIHPVARRNWETGHDTLFLGRRRHSYVMGLPVPESEALLDALWAHALDPSNVWYHRWQVGDLIIWDNRSTMHHRTPFDAGARRILHRTQVNDTPRPARAA